jgi:hypothetical protein
MKDTVRLNFDFPRKYYPYLKMILAGKGLSLKEFASKILIEAIEKAEDELLVQKANERLAEMKNEDLIPWDEATHLAGWDDDKV